MRTGPRWKAAGSDAAVSPNTWPGCYATARRAESIGHVPKRAGDRVAKRSRPACARIETAGPGDAAKQLAATRDEPGGLSLFAGSRVLVQSLAGRGAVDRAHELAMLGCDPLSVALVDGRAQALRQRLHA